jgi:PPP family 3-phenylpropionic acid transporter
MTAGSAAFRLSLFYAAIFAVVGVHLPFWPLWLKDRGLTAPEIGLVVACAYFARIAVAPLIGAVVDRRGDRRLPVVALCGLSAVAWLLFEPAQGLPAIAAVTALTAAVFAGILPVGDSLAMMTVSAHRLDYGRVRLWGSLSFIAAAALVGRLLVHEPPAILLWLVSGLLAVTALVAVGLPDRRVPAVERQAVPAMPLLRQPAFRLFLAAAAANQAAHTVYYSFATIHWKAAGLSDFTIGLLWSEGVVAEIVLFLFSNKAVAKVGPAGLLVVAGLGGAVRWLMLGSSVELGWIVAAQLLHAASFGCAHLGAMHFLQRAVPPGLAVRAQGLHAAIAVGLVPGLTTTVSGGLYDSLAGGAFYTMAGLSALCAVAAAMLARRWTSPLPAGEG